MSGHCWWILGLTACSKAGDPAPVGDTAAGDTAPAGETGAPADTPTDTGDTRDDSSDDSSPADDPDTAAGDTGDTAVPAAPFDVIVMTINLQTPLLGPEPDARSAIVADLILARAPDLVALQEVSEGWGFDDRGAALAAMTGYEVAWAVSADWLGYLEGPGLLSRWPLAWVDEIDLPHDDLLGTVTRKVIGAGATAPGGEIPFFSTHMTLDEDEDVRADQAAAALAFIEAHRGALPAFFAGDTNGEPDWIDSLAFREALVDGWLATHPHEDGYTFPSDGPIKRIDYIYGAPGAEPTSCELLFTEPVDGLYASDHLGVLCTWRVTP